jgi:hypothetical protein
MDGNPIPVEAELTLLRKQLLGLRRRAAIRYRSALANLVRLTFPDTGECLEAWVQNVSTGGVGLSVPRPLTSGTPLILHLRGPARGVTLRLQAQVVHATPQADGHWRVGCALTEELTPEALDTLL